MNIQTKGKTIDYFKRQAKMIFKDFKVHNNPRFFKVNEILKLFHIDCNSEEHNFTLMKAQHIVSRLAQYDNWSILINSYDIDLLNHKIMYMNNISDYKL